MLNMSSLLNNKQLTEIESGAATPDRSQTGKKQWDGKKDNDIFGTNERRTGEVRF